MNKNIKSIVILFSICAVISVLLAVTNLLTSPIIDKNDAAAANEALLQVMPSGEGFESVDISTYQLPKSVTEVYREKNGGYVFTLETAGYSPNLVIMCGVNADKTVSGALCLSSGETLGYEKTYGENFKGKNSDEVANVDTISGATKTTSAFKNAVIDSVNASIILDGGSVDIRSEEEILQDNLSSALPSAEGEFTKLFMVEETEGIDAFYRADNQSGTVCVIGESFIAVDETGKVISDVDEATKVLVEEQVAKINSTVVSDIDLSLYSELPTAIIGAQKTDSGNYVLSVRGAGYGINGGDDYHPASGEYIMIAVSITSDGRIIDCVTLSQAETAGIGDECAKESFYGQFDGKTEADYDDIDAISGATLTTNGYKKAILRAFEAVKIFEGGAADEE